jgi:hypothetical protein
VPEPPIPFFENGILRIKQVRHGVMAYFKTDRFVGSAYDLYGEYSLAEIEVLTALVPEGGVALDIGANFGACTIPLAQKVGDAGRVLCWEPQRLIQQAVGAAPGVLYVPSVNYGGGGNFGGIALQDETGAEAVSVISIDSLDLGRCDLIKVDAEGMEGDVLAGARKTIERHRPFLHVENDRDDKSPGLLALLSELGYEAYWHLNHLYNPDNFFANPNNTYGRLAAVNLLCVPKERKVTLKGCHLAPSPESRWQDFIGPYDDIPPVRVRFED